MHNCSHWCRPDRHSLSSGREERKIGESTKWVSLNACIQTSAGPSIWVDGVSRVAGTVEATVSVDTHYSTVIQIHGTLINVCTKQQIKNDQECMLHTITVVAICVECGATVA